MMVMKNTKWFRRTSRGSVALIAMLLITSAVLRLASGAGGAIAAAADDTAMKLETDNQIVSPTIQSSALKKTASRPEMNKLLVALQEREAHLKKREMEMEMHSKALSVANEEVAKRLLSLEKVEVQLRSTLALADGAAENDLARLTSVYENMKPKDAAALFKMMEPDFAAGFLARMRPDAAAALMTGLPPDVAYSISVILASRNASVPKT